jgi:hypothetical protein
MKDLPITMMPDGWMEKTGGYAKDMTLRDYFAAKAMQGLLAQFQGCANGCDPAHHAKWSYEMADAMLKAGQ